MQLPTVAPQWPHSGPLTSVFLLEGLQAHQQQITLLHRTVTLPPGACKLLQQLDVLPRHLWTLDTQSHFATEDTSEKANKR